jgi:hypothetical protein
VPMSVGVPDSANADDETSTRSEADAHRDSFICFILH